MTLAFISIWFLVGIGVLLFWLWALIDILRNDFRGNNNIVWILVVLFFPFVGSLLYVLMGSDQKI